MGSVLEAKTVVLVSPALADANNGNWHTARRWAQCLAGHCVPLLRAQWPESSPAATADVLIALHARRSAPSIAAWARQCPGKPLIVILTGTDLYRDILDDASAQQSLALATHLVVLQEAGLQALPAALRHKARVIYQSARALKPALKPVRHFRALMVGHLRDEKDPLTWIRAAARLATGPSIPTVRWLFDHIGEALTPELAQAARAAQAAIPGYRWLGGLPQAQTRQHIKQAHVLVNSSRMEGGAQVILQAVQSGTPVLASQISGNIGMLGAAYAGYFPVGDDAALAALLLRCATDADFLALLEKQCRERAQLFDPEAEKRLVLNLVLSALSAAPPRKHSP
ncbi:MAG: selenoneine biosynthesis selenosugar synthase SenB [Polaromonas sp.]|uniref:selenoneine biosynthesis selenosugar synthase SenB n=1 Tax=Polaromonas sp. TaxID=1869339 RepID=UPI002488D681|nr:selenoneine biosynthesis selenosugar synthase SenB [Polaromonas sp.]MDI1239591.1 selenoneine biosynthesis selenosugar synthase SenB [Polaromonas sp.]MDI1339198.1 selenoneine biosynthesis selenosugar synthase SenB [Polaromonas sp.]